MNPLVPKRLLSQIAAGIKVQFHPLVQLLACFLDLGGNSSGDHFNRDENGQEKIHSTYGENSNLGNFCPWSIM